MSSVVNPQPDPQPADELVAYLDGELPPADCRRVESRLATDEDYRQQLHELDRAWEALDALPPATVDDGFARTTIELACVAAQADLTEQTSMAKVANRLRRWRWIAAGAAAVVVGLLAGYALIPDANKKLLADLPAIHQVNTLRYVDSVEFLRQLGKAVPPEQLAKDDLAFERNLKELASVNSPSLDTRLEWVKSLQPGQKADLVDRARVFQDPEFTSKEQESMRLVMEGIRKADDGPMLQKTLVAYGEWLSHLTAGQQDELGQKLEGLAADKQAEFVKKKRIELEGETALTHLSLDDANTLRHAIIEVAEAKRPGLREQLRQESKGNAKNIEEQFARRAAMIAGAELFKGNTRDAEQQLVDKLSQDARDRWKALARSPREFRKRQQLLVWIRDAMDLKVNPEELASFFANEEKLTNDQRQLLLNEPPDRVQPQLERWYFISELGIDPSQFGEPGRWQRNGPGAAGQYWRPGGPQPDGPDRAPGGPGVSEGPGSRSRPPFNGGKPRGKDGAPERGPGERRNERRPPNARPPGPNQPPPKDGKPEAI